MVRKDWTTSMFLILIWCFGPKFLFKETALRLEQVWVSAMWTTSCSCLVGLAHMPTVSMIYSSSTQKPQNGNSGITFQTQNVNQKLERVIQKLLLTADCLLLEVVTGKTILRMSTFLIPIHAHSSNTLLAAKIDYCRALEIMLTVKNFQTSPSSLRGKNSLHIN